jgi:putative ABC transport system permease protein
MSPRWRKVLNDLWGHKVHTLLAVLSIAASVFAVGMLSYTYLFIDRNMNPSYVAIHPAHGVIVAEPFDDGLVEAVERLPSVEETEGRVVLENASILLGPDKKHPLNVRAVEDPATLHMDQLILLSGDWPVKMEMLVVTSRFAQTGDVLPVELPDGRVRRLRVSGEVLDLNDEMPGATGVEIALPVYVSLKTLETLGLPDAFNRLTFRVPGDAPTKADAQATNRDIERLFLRNDKHIFRSTARTPNQHPNSPATTGLLSVLAIVGMLLLAISGFLVTNLISALLAQQVRQIGIMKAVGAHSGQIARMYLTLATCFGGAALLLAAPPVPFAGRALAQVSASILNFSLHGFPVFLEPLLLMLAIGLITPWLAALLPVLHVTRVSTREAITTYGTSAEFGANVIDRLVERLRVLSRPLLLTLRNAVRRKMRMGLTLTALSLAGAAFMSVFTARDSTAYSFERLFPLIWTDLNLDFEHAHRTAMIARIIQQTPGVAYVEGWARTTAEMHDVDGHMVTDRFSIWAPPTNSRSIAHPPITEGRWLKEGDQNALVISTQIVLDHPEWDIGDTVRLHINGHEASFVIVGKVTWVREEGSSMAFSSYAYVSRLLGETGRASVYRVTTESSDPDTVDKIGSTISDALTRQGYTPTIVTLASGKRTVAIGADAIAVSLMILALLIVTVGSIGLTGTMSINVLERTREIGVMRAIGASSGTIRRLVVTEGVMVGILSWLIALGLSLPFSHLLCTVIGLTLLQRPLDYVFNWTGVVIWFGLVIAISVLASLWPAVNAARLTVRDALAYE